MVFKSGDDWNGSRETMFKSGPDWHGNAKGRPKKVIKEPPPPPPPPTVKELAQGHGPEMIAALAEIAKDKAMSAATRVAAANSLLDRGFGKPQQVVETTVTSFDNMSDDELFRQLASMVLNSRVLEDASIIEGELIDEQDEDGGEDE